MDIHTKNCYASFVVIIIPKSIVSKKVLKVWELFPVSLPTLYMRIYIGIVKESAKITERELSVLKHPSSVLSVQQIFFI